LISGFQWEHHSPVWGRCEACAARDDAHQLAVLLFLDDRVPEARELVIDEMTDIGRVRFLGSAEAETLRRKQTGTDLNAGAESLGQ